MSRFLDRFDNHPLNGTLDNIFQLINELMDMEGNQADAIIELERMKHVCTMLKITLDNCDPNLVPISHLDNIQNGCLINVNSH
jgi:hypothetical protein